MLFWLGVVEKVDDESIGATAPFLCQETGNGPEEFCGNLKFLSLYLEMFFKMRYSNNILK